MNKHTSPILTIEERIGRLEKTVRFWQRLAVAIGICLLFVIGTAAQFNDVPDVIRAKRFSLINADGKLVGNFFADKEGSGTLTVSDNQGHLGGAIGLQEKGGGILIIQSTKPSNGSVNILAKESGGRIIIQHFGKPVWATP